MLPTNGLQIIYIYIYIYTLTPQHEQYAMQGLFLKQSLNSVFLLLNCLPYHVKCSLVQNLDLCYHVHFLQWYIQYLSKQDLALNNLPGLICHKTQSTNQINCCCHRLTTQVSCQNIGQNIEIKTTKMKYKSWKKWCINYWSNQIVKYCNAVTWLKFIIR